ncbi:sensor histidine kinase [Pseudomonas aeruginosa]|uniref:sensor histidine kinase n=1 Tax=Pseudomonas TaxID=286 RepID=UPI0015F393FA|nr:MULTISPECIES: sensor histidine kinase [Pseudomonas]MBA6123567.1 sensor histidine kinase [Pseudomonas juntendi]MBA6140639.1 sensor histidine kinase [Pseudomonas monteilii]MCQ1991233.1 ATP-binding protein [Pseudomonas sp. Eb3]
MEKSLEDAALRVSAHVLVQLGSELVTDVEQAILECVKNAYDADSPGCRIDIDTFEQGELREVGAFSKLVMFRSPSENVKVSLFDLEGRPIEFDEFGRANEDFDGDTLVERRLEYVGRITIEDSGDGLSPEQLRDSWLVISNSSKRSSSIGPKKKTRRNRTPLGDKGLGRLGSMKLGDVLIARSAIAKDAPVAIAQFRWTDCETASTVDQIPVYTQQTENAELFKGTRVSVYGLRDMHEWRRKERVTEITRSLTRLISPFEATSTFPVAVTLDGQEQALNSVTNDALARAIAEFKFSWRYDESSKRNVLIATARIKSRLFTGARNERQRENYNIGFRDDGGKGFLESLSGVARLSRYKKNANPTGGFFVEFTQHYDWGQMLRDHGGEAIDPGPFGGAFYFFHLDGLNGVEEEAASGNAVDRQLIKDMSGISILRDGFRVRSQGDWLGISAGMTSGSTYGMRVNNTIGYFSLTGEENFRLVEKSDREGFVEDAAFRGFMQIAETCRDFANDTLEDIRRAFDKYCKKRLEELGDQPQSANSSLRMVEKSVQSTQAAKEVAVQAVSSLLRDIESIERDVSEGGSDDEAAKKAVKLAKSAVSAISSVQQKLESKPITSAVVNSLRREMDENKEQMAALYESAAVGLSARGLAHELRTHLTEIRQRAGALQKVVKSGAFDEALLMPHFRAIRSSCSGIANAAALIDPMLPRGRAIKETLSLEGFIGEYVSTRQMAFEREGINVVINSSGRDVKIRVSRSRLLQILDNIIRNSVYWLRRGQLTGEADREKKIIIDLNDAGFVVSDTGPGVDVAYEESLFEMFVTAKPHRDAGQGLGLFIVTQLLQMDGCEIGLATDRNVDGRRYKFNVDLRSVVVKG